MYTSFRSAKKQSEAHQFKLCIVVVLHNFDSKRVVACDHTGKMLVRENSLWKA